MTISDKKVWYETIRFDNQKYNLHQVIAWQYVPNPENKPCVNHINGDKRDNRPENLEWVSYSENMKHAFKTGLIDCHGIKRPKKRRAVVAIKDDIKKEYLGIAEAGKQLGILHTSIANCLSGRTKTAGGYKWLYL